LLHDGPLQTGEIGAEVTRLDLGAGGFGVNRRGTPTGAKREHEKAKR
jgi:hypothetical protein